MTSNRRVDELICTTGKMEIEPGYATDLINRYLFDLELREKGATLEELGYQSRRQNQRPVVFSESKIIRGENALADYGSTPKGSIAKITLEGVMQMQDGISSNGIKTVSNQLQQAYDNPNISAIIIEINSGGGEATAGSFLHNKIKDRNKPVYAYAHLAASAAYKAAMAADKVILSSPESEVGSIGTMVSMNRRVIEYYKQNREDIYSDGSPNKNREYRSFIAGDRGPLIERINKKNDLFLQLVRESRTLKGDSETQTETLSGSMFTAQESIERGLADGIATEREVLQQLRNAVQDADNFIFSQNQNNNMSNQSLWSRMAQAINSRLGINLNTDSMTEADVEQVETAPTMQQIKDDLKKEIQEAARQDQQDAQNAYEQRFNDLEQKLNDQSQQITQLQEQKTELEGQVAKYLGKTANGKKAANGQPPSIDQFDTAKPFSQIAEPEGTSKY